jgi:hypothetical protein
MTVGTAKDASLSEDGTRPSPIKSAAVCFFGITRSLRYTHGSILRNVIEPLEGRASVRIYGHFFDQERIANPRSGEEGALDREDHRFLSFDSLEREAENPAAVQALFDELTPFGDSWEDGFRSVRNLSHQLYSLKRVTQAALKDAPDLVIFVRPDLAYHDTLADVYDRALAAQSSVLLIPDWQEHGGRNDRFAIAVGVAAAESYGCRFDRATDYVGPGTPLHSEKLLSHATSDVEVQTIPHRASRIRFNGNINPEDFHPSWFIEMEFEIERRLKSRKLWRFFRKPLRLWFVFRHGNRRIAGEKLQADLSTGDTPA